jgi:hypothetical protein
MRFILKGQGYSFVGDVSSTKTISSGKGRGTRRRHRKEI